MSKINLGLVRAGAATPAIKVADPASNAENIIAIINKAAADNTGILVLPELTITGSTCGDLFFQDVLYAAQLEALAKITAATSNIMTTVVLGCYIKLDNALYDCAAVLQNGTILGIVPKVMPDNRYFASGARIPEGQECIRLFGRTIPFGDLIFEDEQSGLDIGVEIGSDMDLPLSPAAMLTVNGADIIVNPAAEPEIVKSASRRRSKIAESSRKNTCGYIFASAGTGESVSDMLYSGHCITAENGNLLVENKRLENGNQLTYTEIDFGKINFERLHHRNYRDLAGIYTPKDYSRIVLS